MIDFLIETDTKLFLFLNGIRSEFWDPVMWWISGKKEWIPLYLAVLGWTIYKFRWKSLYIVPFMVLLVVFSDQGSVFIKNIFQRLRPSRTEELQDLIYLVNNYRGSGYAFVSSHAANTFAFATFTNYLFKNRWFGLFIFFWAAVVSYSRIYLGLHYPGDILFGASFGIVVGALTYYMMKIFSRKVLKQSLED
jgi:undecaprenyl-diphosphatase